MTITGTPPGHIPIANVFSWVFSNPFESGSELMNHAPSNETRNHHISKVPGTKPIFVDVSTGTQLTRDHLRNSALRIAAGLRALGLQPTPYNISTAPTQKILPPTISPVVLIHLPNCLELSQALFGVFAAGLTATLTSTALTSDEVARIIHDAEPQVIITCSEAWPQITKALGNQRKSSLFHLIDDGKVFVVNSGNEDTQKRPPELRDWEELTTTPPLPAPVEFTADEAKSRTAVILWSSGTSGTPKGVVISHQALNASMAAVWHINLSYDENERWLGFIPFYHVFGLVNVLLLAPAMGATVFIMKKYDPASFLDNVEKYRVTSLHMAPPVAVMLAKSRMAEGRDFSSIRSAVSGGAPFSFEMIETLYNRTGIEVKSGYGLSEALSVCNQTPAPLGRLSMHRGNTGVPLYGVEIKIVDGMKMLMSGEEGEILVRSPSIMNCYLKNEDATKESIDEDGWFHTGDLGKINENGFLCITGRLKEIIKVKGFQVSPSELESVLHQSPLVADAAVCSIFDPVQQTERPRGFVVPMNRELQLQLADNTTSKKEFEKLGQEIKKWTEERTAHYKWLRGNVTFVSAIPKSNAGKILRRMLNDVKGLNVDIYPPVSNVKARL